jgi:hypothetical protein
MNIATCGGARLEYVLLTRMGLIHLSDCIPLPKRTDQLNYSHYPFAKPVISLPDTKKQKNGREFDLQKPEIPIWSELQEESNQT